MKMKTLCILIISFIPTIPLTVSADDSSKTYFSAGVMNMTNSALDVLQHNSGVTIDDSDTVAHFSLGYKISPSLALEGGIISGGKVSAASLSANSSGTLYGKAYSNTGAVSVEAKADSSYLLGLKYSGGSGPLSFNIKAGQLFWDVNYASASGTLTYDGSAYSSTTFLEVDGSDPYIGLGLSYEISKNTSLAFDYISTASTNQIEGVAIDLNGYSISWLRNF